MQKKIQDIIDAFENYRFEDSLRQIDQLMKKLGKDNKKKNALSDSDNRMVQIIKCGSLASIGRVHEANHIIETFFTDKVLTEMPDKEKFLFCSICELAYDEKILNKIEILNKTGKGDVRLERFMLSHRLFSQVAKTFLKQFVAEKKEEDGLAQIFLEYMNELNKLQPIENLYSKDLVIPVLKQLNTKMIDLFMMKYLSGINFSKLTSQKLKHSIIDMRLRLAINSNKIQEAKKLYVQFATQMKDNFVYLRSIRDAEENNEVNSRFYIDQCGLMFRRNLNVEQYVPMYDFYDEFLEVVLTQKVTPNLADLQSLLTAEQQPMLKQDEMYSFKQIPNDKVLLQYYLSLLTELRLLTEGELGQKAKSSDYYKISIKGLLLQLLKILYQLAKKASSSQEDINKELQNSKPFNIHLQTYFKFFAKTLTYVNQMKSYLYFLKPKFEAILSYVTFEKDNFKLPNTFGRQDDDLILLINLVKLLVAQNRHKLHELKQIQYWTGLSWQFYQKFISQVEHLKRRQKGEVFLCDEFIIILVDLVTYHVENLPQVQSLQSQQLIESLLLGICCIVEEGTERSPFNGNLKLRLLYIYQKLNYFDKLSDTFFSLDIKSVQFETLGYFLINLMNTFNLYSQLEQSLTRMARSYQENHRETSEYCLKGLKAGTTGQVLEYFSYQKRLTSSFSKMMLFYTLYRKHHNKENSEFYLEWVERRLQQLKKQEKKMSFNCDVKTMLNFLHSLQPSTGVSQYNQYYGVLTSPEVFRFEIHLRKLGHTVKVAAESKTSESQKLFEDKLVEVEAAWNHLVKTNDFNELYDLQKNFSLTEDYLNKIQNQHLSNHSTLTFNIIKKDLLFYLRLAELKIAFFKSAKSIIVLLRLADNNQPLLNQAKQQFNAVFKNIEETVYHFNSKLLWRQQVKNSWSLRETLFTLAHFSKLFNQQAGKLKKIPKPIKSAITQFSTEIQKAVLTHSTSLKFTENLKTDASLLGFTVDEKYMKRVQQRDEMLRRTCTMDLKQAKNYLAA